MATTKSAYRKSQQNFSFYHGGKVQITSSELFAVCMAGDCLNFVNLSSGAVEFSISPDAGSITSFVVTPDEKNVIISFRNLLLQHWILNLAQQPPPHELDRKHEAKLQRSWRAHNAPVLDLHCDFTSTLVASASADRTVCVWDIKKGYCTHNFKGHQSVVNTVRFHPESKRLLLLSAAEDGEVRLWDLVSRSCTVFSNHLSAVMSIAFSPDGSLAVTGGRDKVITVWDLNVKKHKKTIPVYQSVESLCWLSKACVNGMKNVTEQGLIITTGEKGIVKGWHPNNLKSVFQFTASKFFDTSHVLPLSKCQCIMVVTVDQNLLRFQLPSLSRTQLLTGYNDQILDTRYLTNQYIAVATNSEQVNLPMELQR